MPRMKEPRDCERCGEPFRPHYPAKGRPVARFCSPACATAARFGDPVDLVCATCGGPILKRDRAREYCSMECRNKGKRGRPSSRRKSFDDYPAPVRDPESGCLRWQGPHHTNGYGVMGRGRLAHREAWERAVGPIPDGMTIDHVADRGCVHKDCVEVAHLEVVSQPENTSRSAKSREQRARTHCPKGHPYSGQNLITRRGKRECRTCTYARNERNRKKRQATARERVNA